MSEKNQRPQLPSDTHGRSWLMALPDSNDVPEKKLIATLFAADDDLELNVLGAAFVVGASGDRALCMCAAHSLEHVKTIESARQPRSAWTPPPDLVRSGHMYLSPGRLNAAFLMEGEVMMCRVEQLHYVDGNDIALLAVVAPEGRQIFHNQLALDFAIPKIGTQVAVLANEITHVPQGRTGQIGLQIQMRAGVVTEVKMGKTIPGQSCVFYTTAPVLGGMSGAPVLLAPSQNSPMIVCGVVSSDLSPDEAFKSFLVPGRSAVSMLWPSFGLGVIGVVDDAGTSEYRSVAEMAEEKFLDVQTSSAQLSVQQTKQVTKILYQDETYGRILLRTSGHPNARD